ncbi:MAG TPA: helix-turn-helix domain-containing protein, partial [Flavobacterium sp.]|nr:helix-turn-helix domain-containing protein [Flavobacterium sp.]
PADTALGNQELAERSGLPNSTVSRLTYTLSKLGYLVYLEETGKYRMGVPVLGLGYACLSGLKVREVAQPYLDALAADPTSAFGGVLISNTPIDAQAAAQINSLFCEVVIAPDFDDEALAILCEKKNRIILRQHRVQLPQKQVRTCLNGILVQDRNNVTDNKEGLTTVTLKAPTQQEIDDLLFASKICKNTKSNTIVLAKNGQLIASGTGQTSRVDALCQAIEKARSFGFDLDGCVMASDAFFPFPDCVEIANNAGITAVIQPGGSIKDQLSIDYCNENGMAMVFTGTRHFKH